MIAWTDYPFPDLGDQPGKPAPVRSIVVLDWDRDKYCYISARNGHRELIKRAYIYRKPGRWREDARPVPRWRLWFLPRTDYSTAAHKTDG